MRDRLVYTLAAAGVPVDTVTITGPASATVTYQHSATAAQIALGTTIVATFDWSQAADDAWRIANAQAQAVTDSVSGASPVHIGARGGDATVWTFGVNNLVEYFTARFALAASGTWAPTQSQVTAQITAARALAPVDTGAPAPSDVAALMMGGGRITQDTIVSLSQAVIAGGGGNPLE